MFCGKFLEACSAAKLRSIFGGIAVLSLFAQQRLCSTEILASRADTFIAEAAADSELSKSNFIAVSNRRGERAIAYIPFEFDAPAVGLVAARDEIISSKLTLFVKKIPDLPKSENPPSDGGAAAGGSADSADFDKSENSGAVKDWRKSDSKIRIEVFAFVDEEVFEPNTKNFSVSWSGKNAAVAPKHNGVDDKLDTVGLYKLGEIVFDFQSDKYDDGDRVEFSSDELTEYLSFAYGINTARAKSPKFRTPLVRQRYGAIVLRQISGPCEVYFHSANSFGDDSATPENGGVVEREADSEEGGDSAREKPSAGKSGGDVRSGDAPEIAADARNFTGAYDGSVSDFGKPASRRFVKASEWASKTAPSLSENARENLSDISENPQSAEAAAGAVSGSAAKSGDTAKTEESSSSAEKTSPLETPEEDEDADVRPRIDFEFRMTNMEAADSENSDNGQSGD